MEKRLTEHDAVRQTIRICLAGGLNTPENQDIITRLRRIQAGYPSLMKTLTPFTERQDALASSRSPESGPDAWHAEPRVTLKVKTLFITDKLHLDFLGSEISKPDSELG